MKSKVKESTDVAMWVLCKGLILGGRSDRSQASFCIAHLLQSGKVMCDCHGCGELWESDDRGVGEKLWRLMELFNTLVTVVTT